MFDASRQVIQRTGAAQESGRPELRYPQLQDALRRGAEITGHLYPNYEGEEGFGTVRAVYVRMGGETIGRGIDSNVEGALVCADESVADYWKGKRLIEHRADSGVSGTAFDGFVGANGSFKLSKADHDLNSNAVILTLITYSLETGMMDQAREPITADSLEEAFAKAFADDAI